MVHGQVYWFSGIYKISQYTWFNGAVSDPYYHAYYIRPDQMNWGDYVGGKSAQYGEQLTFDECAALCEEHAKEYQPTKKQLKRAEISRRSWTNEDQMFL